MGCNRLALKTWGGDAVPMYNGKRVLDNHHQSESHRLSGELPFHTSYTFPPTQLVKYNHTSIAKQSAIRWLVTQYSCLQPMTIHSTTSPPQVLPIYHWLGTVHQLKPFDFLK